MSISDRDCLLNEIYNNPDDDTAKLKYVDWVQEWSESQEEKDRAELILLMYDIKMSYESGDAETWRAAGELFPQRDEIIKRNPQWYQIPCPKCKGKGLIENPLFVANYSPNLAQQGILRNTMLRTHLVCPVCNGSMDLMYELINVNQIHDSVIYDEVINKLEWNMGFIQSIEFMTRHLFYTVHPHPISGNIYVPTKRILYILKEIPSISRIKIQEMNSPSETEAFTAKWINMTALKPTMEVGKIKRQYKWKDGSIPSPVQNILIQRCSNRFETVQQAYEALWPALCDWVKDWAKKNPKWEEMP